MAAERAGGMAPRGFTLVEIALVVAIISILTVAVLKGQTIIFDSRVASTVSIITDVGAASRAFKDRFRYWPGDLPNPGNSIPNLPAACTGLTSPPPVPNIGDGQINPPVESACALEELFQLGMVKGDPDQTNPPFHTIVNPFSSGTVRLVSAAAVQANYPAPWPATVSNLIEFQNLPCDAVMAIDAKLDDGALNSGRAMASVAACAVGTGSTVPFFAVSLN